MKKWMMLAGLTLAGVAGAQSWDAKDGKLTLVGCYGKQDGVYCDFSFVLTNKQTASVYWSASDFKVFRQDGESRGPKNLSFSNGRFEYTTLKEIIANVPVKLTVLFELPSSTNSLRAIVFNNEKFDNIPVRPYGTAASAPAAASDGWTPVTNLPFPTTFNIGNFKGSFSKCQMKGGTYICGAILDRK